MIFNFSRQQAEWADRNWVKQISGSVKYCLSDEDGNHRGTLYYGEHAGAVVYEDMRIIIDIKRSYRMDDVANLSDDSNNTMIGSFQYKLSSWFREYFKGFTLFDRYYEIRKTTPDVRYSIFKRRTWNHYKFELSNGADEFIYTFKIDYPVIAFGDYLERSRFAGTVKCTTPDLLLAGFFLIEEILRDRRNLRR